MIANIVVIIINPNAILPKKTTQFSRCLDFVVLRWNPIHYNVRYILLSNHIIIYNIMYYLCVRQTALELLLYNIIMLSDVLGPPVRWMDHE